MSEQDAPRVRRAASRQHRASPGRTTLAPSIEERNIIVAQGIERQNRQLPEQWQVPAAVVARLRANGLGGDIEDVSDSHLVFLARRQGVRYTVRVVTRKDQFKEALETAGAHVIYGGHARYGRGPCFGDDPAPGEAWGAGTAPTTNGIFPMAHPYLAVPETEIAEHRYTTRPVLATNRSLPTTDRDQYIKQRRLHCIKVQNLGRDITPFLAGVAATDEVWGYRGYIHGELITHLVLHAGWENTGQPFDLGSTNLLCRVFCHFGCSSFDHNYPVVRFLKNWRRQGNNRYAYWTTAPSNSGNRIPWLYHLLSYRQYNAFKAWHPHLLYALQNTNRELRAAGESYQFI